ncbi:MAG: hypothetical protein JHC86_03960 [Ilumatobacteraceae bacterium]|nr:hypothetical protein [Ilumatobacteraceae bacterium]
MTTLAALPVGAARRVVFLGTPEVAVLPLQALVAAGVDVALVVTRPDKRRGRGGALSPSPVKVAAAESGIRVSHDMNEALTVGADLGVVVAYGRIIPVSVLSQLPMINVHFSQLPRWRGAAPVERAIMAGDGETGICIMRVEEGLDTGVVFDRANLAIRSDHTLTSLRAELAQLSIAPLLRAVTQGCGLGAPQVGEPTHAAKITPDELQVRFTMTVAEVVARTKLETAWFDYGSKRMRLVRAEQSATMPPSGSTPGDVVLVSSTGVHVACSDGVIALLTVKPEGKTAMPAADWANGARLPASLTAASLA